MAEKIRAKKRIFKGEELEELKNLYETGFTCGDGKLDAFLLKHGRNKQSVCKKAKELGYTSRNRKFSEAQIVIGSERRRKWMEENEHPRGMLNKSHTQELKQNVSEAAKERWADPKSQLNSKEHRQLLSDRASKDMAKRLKDNPQSCYSRCKKGTITIGNKTFFARSSWEANIGAYYEFLRVQKEIKDWEHEPETFWFLKILRGVRSYKPDFKITRNDNSFFYVEVKGWMDAKSKTKLQRMEKYYPHIVMELLNEKRYNQIKKMKGVIPNWGMLD